MNTLSGRIILRADAGKQTGYGHFVRSLALAEYLRDQYHCVFASFNNTEHSPTEYQIREIAKVCGYLPLNAGSLEEYDELFLQAIATGDIVVLDNYYFSTDYQRMIRAKGCRLVCVDDMRQRHFVADALLTVCPFEREEFSMEPYTRFLGGIQHSFLRSAFFKIPERNTDHDRIVVAIGGADPFGLTNRIIRLVSAVAPQLHIDVIAGDTVEVDSGRKGISVHRRITAEEIVRIFTHASLGIFPASTVCIEALACRLPIAAGWYVDNQEEFYHRGVSRQLFLPLGNLTDPDRILLGRLQDILSRRHTPPPAAHIDFASGRDDIIRLFHNLSSN